MLKALYGEVLVPETVWKELIRILLDVLGIGLLRG